MIKSVSKILVRLFSGQQRREEQTKKYAQEAIHKYKDTLRKLAHE